MQTSPKPVLPPNKLSQQQILMRKKHAQDGLLLGEHALNIF